MNFVHNLFGYTVEPVYLQPVYWQFLINAIDFFPTDTMPIVYWQLAIGNIS
jgi:hypothetical protein